MNAFERESFGAPLDPPPKPPPLHQWITFLLGDEWFGVPVLSVREVLRDFSIERAPGSPPFVLGLINLRGEILTVVDGCRRLDARVAGVPVVRKLRDLESDNASEDHRIVVVEHGEDVVGLLVDAVADVLSLADAAIEPPPQVGAGARAGALSGIVARPTGLVVLLEPAALCGEEDAG